MVSAGRRDRGGKVRCSRGQDRVHRGGVERRPARRRADASARAGLAGCAGLVAFLLALRTSADGSSADERPADAARSGPRTGAVVIEAPRPPRAPGDPTSFTAVIEADTYAGESLRADALVERAPGVQVRRFGGPGEPSEVSIRGISGPRVVVLLDGIRINSAQSGTVDLSTIPPELIERVEVSRGGGSVQNGSDAIGGVVNIVTRRASAKPTLSLDLDGGSFGTWKASLAGTGRVAGSEVVLGYDLLHSDGDFPFQTPENVLDGVPVGTGGETLRRINNEVDNHAVLARVGRPLGEHWRLEASDQTFYGSAGRPGPANGQGELGGQSPTAHQRRTRNVFDLELSGAEVGPADAFDASLRFFHRYDRSRFFDRDPGPAAQVDTDNRNHAVGVRAEGVWSEELGAVLPESSLGLELREDLLRAKTFTDRERTTVGLFLQQSLAFFAERVLLAGGLRLDHTDGFGVQWIPRFGAELELLPGLRLRGNAERSYRVPNFDELFFDERFIRGNPNLRPEDARNYDVGLELGYASFGWERLAFLRDVALELAWFRNDIRESIVFQQVSNEVVAATNIGAARSQGVEISWSSEWAGWLEFSGSYTRIDAEREAGTPIPGIADRELSLRFVLRPPSERFKIVAERHFTDDIPVSESGGSRVLARTTWDLRATLELVGLWGLALPAESLELRFAATNIGDQSVRDTLFFPQPGRTLTLGVGASW